MQAPLPSNRLVSFRLSTIVEDLLRGFDCVPISDETAESLLMITQNQHTCYVQMPEDVDAVDINGNPLLQPTLWSMSHWLSSCERRQRQKNRSDRERDIRNIYDYNIRLITRAFVKEFGLPVDMANVIARKTLDKKRYGKIAALGVKKLATTIDEI